MQKHSNHDFSSIESAIELFRKGGMLIVVDDEDRENEGDLIMAADFVTADAINFMANFGRGMICAPITEEKAKLLDLPHMISHNTSAHHTAFTVTIDAAQGTSTGISAADRALTIKKLTTATQPDAFVRPGHIFPLIAKQGGVLVRPGHTEAAVDLCKLSNLSEVGVICEIMNPDGSMARLDDLKKFSQRYNLPIITIKDLIHFRLANELVIKKDVTIDLPTDYGTFQLSHFSFPYTGETHVALSMGLDINSHAPLDDTILTRIHSACFTGDIFSSRRCDCGQQLKDSLKLIAKENKGIVIYLNQEGRGVGLLNKLKAYQLQDQGHDTVSANISLGLPVDNRNYHFAYQILKYLGIRSVKLVTNNPDKISALTSFDINVSRMPSLTSIHSENAFYIKTKKLKLNHLIDLKGDYHHGHNSL